MPDYFQKTGESDVEFARRMQEAIQEKMDESKYNLKQTEDYLNSLVSIVEDLSNKYLDREKLVYISQRCITYFTSTLNNEYWERIKDYTEELARQGHKIHIIVAEEVEDEQNETLPNE